MPTIDDPDKEKKTERIWQRVDAVSQLLCENDLYMQNHRSAELCEVIMEKYEVSKRTAQRYISEARKEVNKLGKSNKKKAFARGIRDRQYLFQNAKMGLKDKSGNYITKPNHKLALEIIKDREDLIGLYTQNIKSSGEVTVKNVDMSMFTEYGLDKLKRGELLENVLLDPKSLKQNNADTNTNRS